MVRMPMHARARYDEGWMSQEIDQQEANDVIHAATRCSSGNSYHLLDRDGYHEAGERGL